MGWSKDGTKVAYVTNEDPTDLKNADGYLVAQSDFTEPIGPSYWERLK